MKTNISPEANTSLISLSEARQRAAKYKAESYRQPENFGENNMTGYNIDLQDLTEYLDWNTFFRLMGFEDDCKFPHIIYENDQADYMYQKALEMIGDIIANNAMKASIIVRFFNAYSENDTIVLNNGLRLPMMRQQGENYLCLADFISPDPNHTSTIGLYILKVDNVYKDIELSEEQAMRHNLCLLFTEALAQWMEERISEGLHVIRPEIGSGSCCDISLRKDIIKTLEADKKLGITLDESFRMKPQCSKCGLIIAHESSTMFNIGNISGEQIEDYCKRRGISDAEKIKDISKCWFT